MFHWSSYLFLCHYYAVFYCYSSALLFEIGYCDTSSIAVFGQYCWRRTIGKPLKMAPRGSTPPKQTTVLLSRISESTSDDAGEHVGCLHILPLCSWTAWEWHGRANQHETAIRVSKVVEPASSVWTAQRPIRDIKEGLREGTEKD
jgi:hypothetical protein